MPKISVVIPIYNGENTIKETVESVLNQTFSDFELIVINDGSQDSTLDILSGIQDPRLKVYSYRNAGPGASRNRGIDRACGKFISFLDADDIWTPDKLEAQLQALEKNPRAAVAYSWTDFIDESGQSLGFGIQPMASGDVFVELLKGNFLGSGSNPLILKSVFKDMENFDETIHPAEDWDIYLRLAARYPFVVIPAPQIIYRLSASSWSGDVLKMEAKCIEVLERAFLSSSELSLPLKNDCYANLYMYLASRTLRGDPTRQKGLLASKFLIKAFRNNLAILKQTKLISILITKALSMTLLPPALYMWILNNSLHLFKRPI